LPDGKAMCMVAEVIWTVLCGIQLVIGLTFGGMKRWGFRCYFTIKVQ
jgi:hypothetical protein